MGQRSGQRYKTKLFRGGWDGSVPLFLLRKKRLHDVFQFVSALSILRVIVRGDIECFAMLRANVLQLFLQADGDALGIERIRFGQHERENFLREPVDGIGGPQLAGHRFRRIAPGRVVVAVLL